jgi:hypothetical protein
MITYIYFHQLHNRFPFSENKRLIRNMLELSFANLKM